MRSVHPHLASSSELQSFRLRTLGYWEKWHIYRSHQCIFPLHILRKSSAVRQMHSALTQTQSWYQSQSREWRLEYKQRGDSAEFFLVFSLSFCHYCLSPDLHYVVFDISCNSKTMADIRGNFTSKHQSEGDDRSASCTSCLIAAKALKDVDRDWWRETKWVREWKNREGEQEVGG